MAYVEGEMPISAGPTYAYPPYPYYGNNGNSFFGGDGVWAFLLFAMIFGGNGWGGGFGGFGGGYGAGNAILNATDNNQLHDELNSLQINNKLDGITSNLNTSFGGVVNAITQSGYETRLGLAEMGYNQANCCCQTREAITNVANNVATQIADLKYALATEECATRQASADNTQRIIDFMTQDKLASLTAENLQLKTQIDNGMQTSTIINALRPTPVPAFNAANLYGFYGNGFGGCNGGSIL